MAFIDQYNDQIKKKESEKERIRMNVIKPYRTPNNNLVYDRMKAYKNYSNSLGDKNYNINRLTFFRDITDGVEILADYINAASIRSMYIPSEIIYESIYRELPELFEE